MNSKRIIKICCSEWNNENRDKRELSVCKALGMDVAVMAKGDIKDCFKKDVVDGYDVFRFSTRPFKKISNTANRVISVFLWSKYARRFKADIFTCHDLTALFIGYLSNIGKKRKSKLVYDSHEFELGRNVKRKKITVFFIRNLEKFLMNKCAFSIMVNDSIADEVQKIHKLKTRPIVVRSTPNCWKLDIDEITKTRDMMLSKLEVKGNTFLVMYHGGLMKNRGIENAIKAINYCDNCCLVILGNGEEKYVESLKQLVKTERVNGKVLFLDAVTHTELYKYVGAANVGFSILTGLFKNHYYALPNKFFENIQALTPIIVSDFPEMATLVDMYNIGLKIDPNSVDELANAINTMSNKADLYNTFKNNLKHAKKDLCWEREQIVLKDAYKNLLLKQ